MVPIGPSPLAVLGLRPGASRAEVDEAYRRLIKQHHPDLPGGDPSRASEINRAYAVLKSGGALDRQVTVAAPPVLKRKRGRRLATVAGLAGATAGIMLVPLPQLPLPAPRPATVFLPASPSVPTSPDGLGLRTLPDEGAVRSGVAEAIRLANGDAGQVADYSRSCNEDLQSYPSSALLDHCVAFDTAAANLLPDLADRSEFASSIMAQRHVEAALNVSDNPVAAEARVAEVRREAQRLALMVREAGPGG